MWTTYPQAVAVRRRPRRLQLHATATATRYGNRYADSYYGTASNSGTAATANTGASPVGRSGSEKILTISL